MSKPSKTLEDLRTIKHYQDIYNVGNAEDITQIETEIKTKTIEYEKAVEEIRNMSELNVDRYVELVNKPHIIENMSTEQFEFFKIMKNLKSSTSLSEISFNELMNRVLPNVTNESYAKIYKYGRTKVEAFKSEEAEYLDRLQH
jgi:hypothetical protein